MSAASSPIVFADTRGRQVSLGCEHGEAHLYDRGPTWTRDQLVSFSRLVLAARARCTCFGRQHVWMPPRFPEHVTVEVRLFEVDEPLDPSIDRVRPVAIPGRAVSLAAERVFETAVPADDHSLAADLRLVRLWYRQRQLGLLANDC